MAYRLIDRSDTLSNRTREHEPNAHEIVYVSPEASATNDFGVEGLWLDGKGWAVETVTLSTHSGTHVDAQHHYGGGGRTIDEVPLEWCFGPGVLRHADRVEGIGRSDVEAALAERSSTSSGRSRSSSSGPGRARTSESLATPSCTPAAARGNRVPC